MNGRRYLKAGIKKTCANHTSEKLAKGQGAFSAASEKAEGYPFAVLPRRSVSLTATPILPALTASSVLE